MIKVTYPFSGGSTDLKDKFNSAYYNSLKGAIDESKINPILTEIEYLGAPLTFEQLLTADFPELLYIHSLIEASTKKTEIENLFKVIRDKKTINTYDTKQGIISNFFMGREMNLKTCHYCNIDYINVFEEKYFFADITEFINNAPKEVLRECKSISEETAKKIIRNRNITNVLDWMETNGTKKLFSLFKTAINKGVSSRLDNLDLNNIVINKNHFTLDHFLPKNEFPYFGLSLYNLVPSCNSCNCKFKGALEFLPTDFLKQLCPTSDHFCLHDDLQFKIYFNKVGYDLSATLQQVSSLKDFNIKIEDKSAIEGFERYLNMFKLKGRYEFHRKAALDMIEKRKDYPDSEIKEISDYFVRNGIYKDENSIKKDLFGSSIFNENEKNEPFAKYKSDIARQLGILKS